MGIAIYRNLGAGFEKTNLHIIPRRLSLFSNGGTPVIEDSRLF